MHQAAVRGFVARYVWDRDEVEDLAQEVLLAAHHGLASFAHDARFRTWLLGIAYRKIALHLRVESRRQGQGGRLLTEAITAWALESCRALRHHDRCAADMTAVHAPTGREVSGPSGAGPL